MDLNIISFTYLFLRLAPFILVCFFSLASIFNQDFKGLVYLVGLIFSCFIAIMIGNASGVETNPNVNGVCNMITINGAEKISKLPLGQTVFGYTYAYLLYSILLPTPNLVMQNIPTIVFFPILISFDAIWNITNSCENPINLIMSLIIGSGCGVLWGYMINKTNTPALQYFANVNNGETCNSITQNSKQTFRCNVYKNGKIISQNIGGS